MSYPGTRLWEQMVPVSINESWRKKLGKGFSVSLQDGKIMVVTESWFATACSSVLHINCIIYSLQNTGRLVLSAFYARRKWSHESLSNHHVVIHCIMRRVMSLIGKSKLVICSQTRSNGKSVNDGLLILKNELSSYKSPHLALICKGCLLGMSYFP